MQQSKLVETWVGLFIALGVAGLFFLAMKVSNLGDLQTKDNSYKITARFQNAGSLRERAPVSMAGVRVGRVSSIRFDKKSYEAVVEMRIDPEYDTIPEDTTANVLTAGLLGEQYIGLSAGGSEEYLKNGDEIELTQSALVLEEVISRFLFNKAEGGGEKAATASAPAEDKPEDTTLIAEPPVKPKPPVAAAKEASKPPHHALAVEENAASAHKAKPAGKAQEEAHTAQTHKGKVEEEPNPTHKPAKPTQK